MISLEIDDAMNTLTEDDLVLLRTCADAAAKTEGISIPLYAYLRITDDADIRSINASHRNIDSATDVLSFPSISYPEGKHAADMISRLHQEYDPEMHASYLGDIIISIDHMRQQARAYGHSEAREAGFLLTHALFHLMGYDHIEEQDRQLMRTMEERSLESIGLSRKDEQE